MAAGAHTVMGAALLLVSVPITAAASTTPSRNEIKSAYTAQCSAILSRNYEAFLQWFGPGYTDRHANGKTQALGDLQREMRAIPATYTFHACRLVIKSYSAQAHTASVLVVETLSASVKSAKRKKDVTVVTRSSAVARWEFVRGRLRETASREVGTVSTADGRVVYRSGSPP